VILTRMKHAVLVAALAVALSGCVTGAGIIKHQQVSLPLLIGVTAADILVTSLAASQIQEYSYAGSLATGLAVTAVDVVAGCLLGSCSSLRL
jgi:hypothetical protein